MSSSQKITPYENTSLFSSLGSLRSTSGAIHSGVPALLLDERNVWFFMRLSPKSHTFTTQCLSTSRLGDFRSRCTITGTQLCR